ncbi:tyrosine--tRNA ligase, partial [bacterium]|nr:tyrosine--tRNA ligase [bacterium]
SAPDIHLGHVVVLRKLRQFQDLGHEVQFLIGDFTGLIGDPTGKSKTRPVLTKEEIGKNAQTYRDQIGSVLDMKRTKIVFNSDWLSKMNFQDVLMLAGKYTVARMLERDDFENRYKTHQPISISEFLYPLMQGYDSVAMKADVELGGTDQKFNLLVGRSLQREYGQVPQVILTMPLLVGLDGVEKMSKSLGNYVGISEAPKDMFGKLMSIPDNIMWNYWELLTDHDMNEIKKMKNEVEEGKLHPMTVKKDLAVEIISQFHTHEEAKGARDEFEKVFSKKENPTDMEEYAVSESELSPLDISVVLGFAPSKSEAKRLIKQGGFKVDGKPVTDPFSSVTITDGMVIKYGKRKFGKIIKK